MKNPTNILASQKVYSMKNYLIIFLLFSLVSCMEGKRQITKWDDYAPYLVNNRNVSNDPIQEELKFWENRLEQNKQDEASLVKLGALNSELFRSTGLIHHILLSDSLYNLVLKEYP